MINEGNTGIGRYGQTAPTIAIDVNRPQQSMILQAIKIIYHKKMKIVLVLVLPMMKILSQ